MFRSRTAILGLGVLVFALPSSQTLAAAQEQLLDVDAYVEEQRELVGIPGLGVVVVAGDEVAYAAGHGEANPDGRPMTADTPLMIGSVSKSMTALAAMQLVDDGLLALDEPVQTYLPWFEVADSEAASHITVRHLLQQTSGFSTQQGRDSLGVSDLSDRAIEDSVRELSAVELAFRPGEKHEYSNTNYDIVGLLIQVVSGQSYESYMEDYVFQPLGMTHTFTSHEAAEESGLARGHLAWFGFTFSRTFPYNRGHLPSGHIMTSAADMGHYLIAQLNEGRFEGLAVVSPESMAAMHRQAVDAGEGDFYGMGWYVDTEEGHPVVSHDGDNLNYSAFVLMKPVEELGVAVLLNANGLAFNGAASQIAEGVMALVEGGSAEPYQAPGELTLVIGSVVVPVGVALLWVTGTMIWFVRSTSRRSPLKIGLLLLVDLGLLFVLLLGIPMLWQLPLRPLFLMFPDMATLILAGVVAVGGWAVLRTVLMLRPEAAAAEHDVAPSQPVDAAEERPHAMPQQRR